MDVERIALISDIHGNVTALEAVLADIQARGITRILNLGDIVGKGPRGSLAVERCREACELTVRGNWDDFIGRIPDDGPADMLWWRDELSDAQRDWLEELPQSVDLTMSGRAIRLFHASAWSPHVRVRMRHSAEEFADMFRNTPMTGDGPTPEVVGYGDIHRVYVKHVAGRMLFNIGSVGNPLDEPVPSYGILSGVPGGRSTDPFDLEIVRVPYDIEAEVGIALALGMPTADLWQVELRTAVYRGLQ